jgi:endoglucanase
VAKKREIPFQLSILPKGGTDAGPMQRARGGFRTMTLSVPTRYIHTVTECIHKRDLQSAIDLLAAWLEG